MHLMVSTRPDIGYVEGRLTRHCQYPIETHWKAMKRAIRYLSGTKTVELKYDEDKSGEGNPELTGYTDSSYADDLVDRRSTTAYLILLNGGAVAWASKKAQRVALSSTESEYMALSQSAK